MGAPVQASMASGEDIFGGAKSVLVKQEFAAVELCGIEAKNRYRVSVPTGDGRQEGAAFLYLNEESQCLERICCNLSRSLKMMVHQGGSKDGDVLMTMHKNFSCPGPCPCLRPRFDVFEGTTQNKIGSIEDPCRCCTIDQQVFNGSGKLMYTTSGSGCQGGMFCPMCCDVNVAILKEGKKVGNVSKLALSCGEACAKTNRFCLDMEQLPDPEERKMALAAAMLLDLQYFEQQQKN